MTITKKFVENLGSMYGKKPCSDGMNWYIENFKAPVEHTEVFEKAISDGVVKYATWAIAYSMTKPQAVKWAIYCAYKVLPIFEAKYPNNDRPRKAIEAAKAWLKNPCDETREVAEAESKEAAEAAQTAAEEAEEAAAWAAWAAEWAAWAAWSSQWAALEWSARAAYAVEAALSVSRPDPTVALDLLNEGFRIWKDS